MQFLYYMATKCTTDGSYLLELNLEHVIQFLSEELEIE